MDIIEYQCPTDFTRDLPTSFKTIRDIANKKHTEIDIEDTVKISIALRELTPIIVLKWPIQKLSDALMAVLPTLATALAPTQPPVSI